VSPPAFIKLSAICVSASSQAATTWIDALRGIRLSLCECDIIPMLLGH
jgi:hypothetical protein